MPGKRLASQPAISRLAISNHSFSVGSERLSVSPNCDCSHGESRAMWQHRHHHAEEHAQHGDHRAFERQQRQHMAQPRAHGAQHGEFAAAFVQARHHHRHQPRQAHQRDQRRHQQQRVLADADHAPQFVQRHAGQDGHQRFAGVGGNPALHAEHRGAVLQAHQRGRHVLGREVELAHLLGGNVHARHRRAAHPFEVDRFHGRQADVHRAVDRRAGAREHAHHGEGLVGMLEPRELAAAVRQRDLSGPRGSRALSATSAPTTASNSSLKGLPSRIFSGCLSP